MPIEIIPPEAIRARALGVALLTPSFDELCYRVAALSIGFEQMAELAQESLKKANQESDVSTMAVTLFKQLEPLMARGKQYTDLQKKFRENKQRIDDAKHDQWRKWQADEITSNAQFAKQSKQEQAKRLKEKHSIPEKFGSIAKCLEPLAPGKRKK